MQADALNCSIGRTRIDLLFAFRLPAFTIAGNPASSRGIYDEQRSQAIRHEFAAFNSCTVYSVSRQAHRTELAELRQAIICGCLSAISRLRPESHRRLIVIPAW